MQIGGAVAPVAYSGPQGTYTGLDQLNIVIPSTLAGRGEVDLLMNVDGSESNRTKLKFERLSGKSSIYVTSSVVTNTDPKNLPPNCGRPAEHADFTANQDSVMAWFAFSGGDEGESATLEWYDPAGRLRFTTLFAPKRESGGNWCYWSSRPLAGGAIAKAPGEWTVKCLWAGEPQFTMPFRVRTEP